MNPRSQLIILEEPKAPEANPPFCRWCGLEIEYTDLATGYRRTRNYHRGDRYEVGNRNCRREHKLSFCWSGRDALRWKSVQEHGRILIYCADCGEICEEGKARAKRRVGFHKEFVTLKFWHADHEVPLVDGGAHVLDNLTARCVPCHKVKTAREAQERAERVRIDIARIDPHCRRR